jgi:hypothetical protein
MPAFHLLEVSTNNTYASLWGRKAFKAPSISDIQIKVA